MLNAAVREAVLRILPRVKTPAQYIGGERNSVTKDHRQVRGKLCLCFPDAYTIGMSHHGLQVLYTIMNNDPQWACERSFTPWMDFESELRRNRLPLYGLETFTPLSEFDVLGFSLQYEVCYTNLLTMLDLGGIPHFSRERRVSDPLVVAGGPGAQNPELLAPFVDLFVIGDGEESLPWVMEKWMTLKEEAIRAGDLTHKRRLNMLAELAGSTSWAYAPAFYEFDYHADGTIATVNRTRSDVPTEIASCTITQDLDAIPLPTRPVVSFVQTPHDRIAIEIMRGCPWQCRFCQSTVIKRPLRVRSVETIVQAALDSYRNSGMNEISLLSLSSSDYPHFEELVKRMHEVFAPLGVNVSLPSLRVNHQLRSVPKLMQGWRRAGLTLAPEVARDDMREQIRKKIKNEDLIEGCREAFKEGMSHVKLYFLCGLPGERQVDLDGIVELSEEISAVGKQGGGLSAPQEEKQKCEDQAARHRDESAGRHPHAGRPTRFSRAIRGLEARCPHGWLEGMLQRGTLVAGIPRPGNRCRFLSHASEAHRGETPLGPRQREEGPCLSGERAGAQCDPTESNGRCGCHRGRQGRQWVRGVRLRNYPKTGLA
jgi:radical SAM family uncharacterized protein